MAKQSYKIPADLNYSYGNMEIVLSAGDGVNIKPLPVKVILFYVASAILLIWTIAKTFVGTGYFWQIALFVILWVGLTILLASYDKTRRMKIQLITTLLNYIPKRSRYVGTRTIQSANPFYSIAGIESISDNGQIRWADGTYGFMYRVVGSASILLFDGDKNAILDRVDNFYRKLGIDGEVGFITTKESQKVYRQIAHLMRIYENMENADPDLQACAEEQFKILRDYVGDSFRSIHQYMFLKGDNQEALLSFKNVLQSEVENSAYMIKQCIPLYPEDIFEVFRLIYQDDVSVEAEEVNA